jgi:hypothetical protein
MMNDRRHIRCGKPKKQPAAFTIAASFPGDLDGEPFVFRPGALA